jgi:hypothetical protein
MFGLWDANLISLFFNMSSTKWVAVPSLESQICTYLSGGRSYIVYSVLYPPLQMIKFYSVAWPKHKIGSQVSFSRSVMTP